LINEFAAFSATNTVFKNVNVNFCLFHFCQTVFRHIKKEGLVIKYEKDTEFRNYCRLLFALPFEKPEKIQEKFKLIEKKMQMCLNKEQINSFLKYFEDTFIGTPFKNAIFKANNLSLHNRIVQDLPITTNIAEGWNRGINNSFTYKHPNINDFIKELRGREFLITEKIYDDMCS
jgi:hypothetical protein